MKSYETVFVLQPEMAEEARIAAIEKVKAVIEAAGTVTDVDEWGLRKMAYVIDKKYAEGYYVVISFNAENSVLPALEHLYRVTDGFIRDIVICRED